MQEKADVYEKLNSVANYILFGQLELGKAIDALEDGDPMKEDLINLLERLSDCHTNSNPLIVSVQKIKDQIEAELA